MAKKKSDPPTKRDRTLARKYGVGANQTQSQGGLGGKEASRARGNELSKRWNAFVYGKSPNKPGTKKAADALTGYDNDYSKGNGRFYGRPGDPGNTSDGGWPAETGKRGSNKYGGTAEKGFKKNRLKEIEKGRTSPRRMGA